MHSSPSAFQACIHTALGLKESQLKGAIATCNKLLRAAIVHDQGQAEKNYSAFLKGALERSAGRAHALLKTFEKDHGTSYELIDDARSAAQGVSIKERMTTRFYQWGIKKWDVLNPQWQDDLR